MLNKLLYYILAKSSHYELFVQYYNLHFVKLYLIFVIDNTDISAQTNFQVIYFFFSMLPVVKAKLPG